MKYSVYHTPPEDFQVQYDVLGCYIVVKNKFLLLKRQSGDQSGKWCIPAGRREEGETFEEALFREIEEETSVVLLQPQHLDTLHIIYHNISYRFHMYVEVFETEPTVVPNSEHSEFQWISPEEALKLPLIAGGEEAISVYMKGFS